MNLQLHLRREADDLRAERLLTVETSDGKTTLTLTEGPSVMTGHTVQRVTWVFTDAERAAILGALAAEPAEGDAEFLEVGEHPLISHNALAAAVLTHIIESDGHEFRASPMIKMADRLCVEGLARRVVDAADVVTYHATDAGKAAHVVASKGAL